MSHLSSSPTDGEPTFLSRFHGRFVGVLRWEQLDELWATLLARAELGWYVYHVGAVPPQVTISAEQLQRVVAGIDAMLHHDHEYDYCGIVYTDSLVEPTFIKIFDPHQLGSSCGSSGVTVLPSWTLSLLPPTDLPAALPPPNNRRHWWQRLFA